MRARVYQQGKIEDRKKRALVSGQLAGVLACTLQNIYFICFLLPALFVVARINFGRYNKGP